MIISIMRRKKQNIKFLNYLNYLNKQFNQYKDKITINKISMKYFL